MKQTHGLLQCGLPHNVAHRQDAGWDFVVLIMQLALYSALVMKVNSLIMSLLYWFLSMGCQESPSVQDQHAKRFV